MAKRPICKIDGCGKAHHAKGYCHTHYESHRLGRVYLGTKGSRRATNKGRDCQVVGCDKPSASRGLCHGHHAEVKVGRTKVSARARRGELLEWIRANIDHCGESCLAWPYGRDQKGYGAVKFEGIQTNAHRVMCILAHGRPPAGREQAAHSCGQGHMGCVNPRHLSWKSAKENCADREMHNSISCREDS